VTEYFLFTLPVLALLLFAKLYLHALVFCVILILIAYTVPSNEMKTSRTINLRKIPAGMFEWQAGIRKNWAAIVLFYFAGLFGFYQVWFSAVSLFMLTLVFVSFYSEYEPRNMLAAGGRRSSEYLMRKVLEHTVCFALFLLPLFFIALYHDEYQWITLGYFLASLNLQAFAILLKYYQYRPASYSGAHQMLTTLGCFISILLPIALLFVLFNLFLATGAYKNLKMYLDAGN
jgi:hypothetical protein